MSNGEGEDRFGSDPEAAGIPAVANGDAPGDSPRKQSNCGLVCCLCCQCSFCLALVCAVSAVGILFRFPDLVTNFDAFTEADTTAYFTQSGFNAAKKSKADEAGRRLLNQLYRPFDIQIGYGVVEGSAVTNLLTSEALSAIRGFESALLSHPMWQDLCRNHVEQADHSLCSPGISMGNYIAPKLDYTSVDDIVPSGFDYTSNSREPLPVAAALYLAKTHKIAVNVHVTNWVEADTATELRTLYRFNFVCCLSNTPTSEQIKWLNGLTDKWDTLLAEVVIPYFDKMEICEEDPDVVSSEKNIICGLRIAYGGTGVRSKLIWKIILGDISLAAASMVFVLCYLMFHTQSVVLSIVAILVVFLSIPLSYVGFAFIADSVEMNIASLLSLFLIVGLGSDVIFVYTDFWKDSAQLTPIIGERYLLTLRKGAKATLATSIATALSFFANLASVLRPLREFGFFMGLCVLLVWALVPLIYLPHCVFDDLWFSGIRLDCCDRRKKVMNVKTRKERFMSGLILHIFKCRCFYLIVPSATLIAMGVFAIASAGTSTEVPGLLPKEHELEKQDVLLSLFTGLGEDRYEPKPLYHAICDLADFDAKCNNLYWCEADRVMEMPSPTMCWHLWRKKTGTCVTRELPVRQRIFNAKSLTSVDLELLANKTAELLPWGELDSSKPVVGTSMGVAPMILHDWLAGEQAFYSENMQYDMPFKQDPYQAQTACGFDVLWVCDKNLCEVGSGWSGGAFQTMVDFGRTDARRLGDHEDVVSLTPGFENEIEDINAAMTEEYHPHSRQLQRITTTTFVAKQARVDAAFGLMVIEGSPLFGKRDAKSSWRYSETFEAADPWAQRNLYQFCDAASMEEAGLLINERSCWIQYFQAWLKDEKNIRFPVRRESFHSLAYEFAKGKTVKILGQAALLHSIGNFMWFEGGNLKASYFQFLTQASVYTSGQSATAYRTLWDAYLVKHVPPGLDGVPAAFHTSKLWVQASAQDELTSNFFVTLGIVVVLAFAAMEVFTESPSLSLMVVMCTILVLCGLTFVIVVLMKAAIGPVEAIALIVFIGYAVTYSLHIAHHYGEAPPPDEDEEYQEDLDSEPLIRRSRTMFAAKSIASGITGSAITTFGCSFFLVLCTIPIFKKLGLVAIAVTVLSILVSLVVLPAGLMMYGPLNPGIACECFYAVCPCFRRCLRAERRRRKRDQEAMMVDTDNVPTSPPTALRVVDIMVHEGMHEADDPDNTKFSI